MRLQAAELTDPLNKPLNAMNKSPLRILFLEDSEPDVFLIQRQLKEAHIRFTAMIVDTRNEFENALRDFRPEVILSDHSLPQFNSAEALKIYKTFGCKVPFILVTGTVSEEFAAQAIKEGADDYILKTNLTRLPAAITASLKTRQQEQQNENFVEEIKQKNIFLEQLMNSQPVAFFIARAGGDYAITYISENVKNITGYDAKQFVDDPALWPSNIHPEDAAWIFPSIADIFKTGRAEYRWKIADGSVKWFLANFTIVKEQDEEEYAHGVWIDITSLKTADHRKAEYLKGLEQMLFMTSHKVRQPVAQILGISKLLDHPVNSQDELKEIMGLMKEPAVSLEKFTRELTAYMDDLKIKTNSM